MHQGVAMAPAWAAGGSEHGGGYREAVGWPGGLLRPRGRRQPRRVPVRPRRVTRPLARQGRPSARPAGHGHHRGVRAHVPRPSPDSRAGDPLLHTHVIVANRVQGPDGRWTALDGRDLYRHRLAADAIYRGAYQRALTRSLGVAWSEADRWGNRELVGMPAELLRSRCSMAGRVVPRASPARPRPWAGQQPGPAERGWGAVIECRAVHDRDEPAAAPAGRAAEPDALLMLLAAAREATSGRLRSWSSRTGASCSSTAIGCWVWCTTPTTWSRSRCCELGGRSRASTADGRCVRGRTRSPPTGA
jgi:TrwC relaxase